MATANHWWAPIVAKVQAFGKWLVATMRSQWVATALIIPMIFFGVQTYVARQDAKQARIQSINVDRISKVQDSGKALDIALASYFQSVSELGLAERGLRAPGTYTDIPLAAAQAAVVASRAEARKAFATHASDVQSLRGVFDPTATTNYVAALAAVDTTIENGEIKSTGENITALARLVKARNELVDSAIKSVA